MRRSQVLENEINRRVEIRAKLHKTRKNEILRGKIDPRKRTQRSYQRKLSNRKPNSGNEQYSENGEPEIPRIPFSQEKQNNKGALNSYLEH